MKINLNSAILKHLEELKKARSEAQPQVSPRAMSEPQPSAVQINLSDLDLIQSTSVQTSSYTVTDKYGNPITLNQLQDQFVRLSLDGQDCILTGAAGTGKTTTMNGCISALDQKLLPSEIKHKYLESSDLPGLIFCAFTHVAVRNLQRNLPSRYSDHAMTIHKLLAFEPTYEEILTESGQYKTKMNFEPRYNKANPLPSGIQVIVIDECSMVPVDLWKQLESALAHKVQFIFLGDIQQLPPAFGPAIMGFKMLDWPMVELKEVYRQALDSPIIRLAHRILSGEPIMPAQISDWTDPNLRIYPAKTSLSEDVMVMEYIKAFQKKKQLGRYDPTQDIILIPYNVGCGQIALNKGIANFLARERGAATFEIRTGFENVYLSLGDRVLNQSRWGTVIKIETNYSYSGPTPQPPSLSMDYYGIDVEHQALDVEFNEDEALAAIDRMLESGTQETRQRAASHKVLIQYDDESEEWLSSAGDLNNLLLGYACTIYKAQGSEWRRVFCCFHKSHKSLCREALYTAVTRAREELIVFCEKDTFIKGIVTQKIKGKTLEDKAQYFMGKKDSLS